MQYRGNVVQVALCLVATLGSAAPNRWAEFDKPPLTILYPEDEAISNPPFFHWQAAPGAASYRLKVTGAGFETTWTTPRNFFTPEETLKPGNYVVELSALDAGGGASASLPKPSLREFRLPEGRPGLVVNMNAISVPPDAAVAFPPNEIKALRASGGDQGSLRDRLIEYARAAAPSPIDDLREPPAYSDGQYHYDEWNTINNACFAVEEYCIREAVAFRLTGEKEFADRAKKVLLAAAQWDPSGSTGVWSSDHSAWCMLHALSFGYNLLRDQWTPEEKALLRSAIVARGRDMYGFLNPFIGKVTAAGLMNDPDNNHPWFCAAALGIGGLAVMNDVPEAREWVEFTTQLFHGVFLPRGGSRGGWHEGIDYWSYTLYFVFQYCDALKTASGVDLYQHPWLRNTAFFNMYVHPPRGGYVPFGDCKHHEPTAFDKLVMMRLASEYKDPAAWNYVDAIPHSIDDSRLVYALQWSDRDGVDNNKAVEFPFAREFTDIGWAVCDTNVFRVDDQILFAFRSGKFFGRRFGHSHADQNHFILAAGGDKLLWDAGYYDSYLSPHHKQYTSQSVAHNVILVGGQGQVAFTPGTDGKITEFSVDGRSIHVQGDASKPIVYGGRVIRWVRTVDFKDLKELTVRDDIFLADPDTVSWLLHSAYPILFNPKDNSIEIVGDHYQLAGRFETDAPIEAILTTKFPVEPGGKARQYNDPKDNPYKDEFHLELRTVGKLEIWKPTLRLTLTKREK